MNPGIIVIVDTGQVGTVVWTTNDSIEVLLRNGDIWTGNVKLCRLPQGQEELDLAPIDVERQETKRSMKK